jgi:SET domain-containing protein
MFNHSTLQQNIGWKRNTETDVIVYSALRDISSGEELCISYGSARLWFRDADADAIANTAGDHWYADGIEGETPTELELSGLGKLEL